jgi:hypothetical protein
LNFGREDGFGDFVYDDSTQPMCFWDTKSNGANGITDYYAVASTFLTRLSTLTLLGSKGPMQPLNPCPLPGNCSYSIDFAGPAYRCQEHEDFESSATTNMTKSQFIPAGNYSYYSVSSVSEDKDGRPIWWDNASEADLGYFRTEPELWIGYAINTTKPLPKPVNTPWGYIWNNDYLVKVLKCEMFNATYSYTLNWHNGVMFVEAATRKLLFPIPGFSPSINASYGYRATA